MQQKGFCGLYTTSAKGILAEVSEKRVADEMVNRVLEPSTLMHSGRILAYCFFLDETTKNFHFRFASERVEFV